MSNNFHLQLYRGTTAQNDAYTGLSGEVTVDTTLSKLRLHDGSTKGGVEIGGMPVGSIIPYAGTTIPAGYLLCDGSAISRTTYSALFASIGTTYGAGDGNSTFNIPNLIEKFIEGSDNNIGTVIEAGLPNIQGYLALHASEVANIIYTESGCFQGSAGDSNNYRSPANLPSSSGASSYGVIHFNASNSSSIYGNSNTVQPPALTMSYCIKY